MILKVQVVQITSLSLTDMIVLSMWSDSILQKTSQHPLQMVGNLALSYSYYPRNQTKNSRVIGNYIYQWILISCTHLFQLHGISTTNSAGGNHSQLYFPPQPLCYQDPPLLMHLIAWWQITSANRPHNSICVITNVLIAENDSYNIQPKFI